LKPLAEPLGSRHRLAYLSGVLALLAFALLLLTARASADQIYWVNQESISYSDLKDTAGGFLPASVGTLHSANGMAIDTAAGRVYIAQEASNQISWYGLDGETLGVLNTAPGSVDHPVNITIDPETQTLYWANDTSPGSIGYAAANGSGGGILAAPGTSGADVDRPSRVAMDTLHHRVYWWNEGTDKFSWITTNRLLGENLATPNFTIEPGYMGGIAIEPYSTPEELFFINNEPAGEEQIKGIFHTDPLLGGPPEAVQEAVGKKTAKQPTGLAYDATSLRFYWANRGVNESPKGAIGSGTLFGHSGLIPVFPVAPVHNPAFASILKQPVATGEPEIAAAEYTLSCTLGHWATDQPGASVYAAPTTYRYEWRRGNTVIEGANANTLTATESGSYSCAVAAANAAGVTVAKSHSVAVTFPDKPKETTTTTTTTTTSTSSTPKSTPKSTDKPAPTPKATAEVTPKLASAKPAKAKAGGTAVIKVDLANAGGAAAGSTKVCATLTKAAQKGLKPANRSPRGRRPSPS
jgi:hypothetical protein